MEPMYRYWRLALPGIAMAATALAFFAAVAGGHSGASAQGDGATLRLTLPTPEITEGDERIPVEVHVEGAANMASVQFDLEFNAEVFEPSEADPEAGFEPVVRGPFLSSSGREVVCNTPTFDTGIVRYLCVTLRPEPAGPDGAGLIATVYLDAIGSGNTDLVLDNVDATQAGEENPSMPIVGEGVTIDVAGSGLDINWIVWGPIIGLGALAAGGAAAFGAMRLRSGTQGGGNTATAT
jgi:hypothetical protein